MSSQDEETTIEETEEQRQRRKELRHQYHLKKKEIRQNRDALVSDTVQMNSKLDEVDELFSGVKNPREAVLDSALIKEFACMAKEKAKDLRINFDVFQPLEFAENAVTFMRGDQPPTAASRSNPVTPEGWARLGAAAAKCFNKPPEYHYMFGSFERGEPAPTQKRQRLKKEKDSPVKATRPQEVREAAGGTAEEQTTEEVEFVLKQLKKWYARNKNEPICYFEFVTNPHSFGYTIENIFHVAFLIKDGHAKISLDSENLPTIEPVETPKGEDKRKDRNSQFIMSITQGEWEKIVKEFKISKPLIHPRKVAPAGKAPSAGPSSTAGPSTSRQS